MRAFSGENTSAYIRVFLLRATLINAPITADITERPRTTEPFFTDGPSSRNPCPENFFLIAEPVWEAANPTASAAAPIFPRSATALARATENATAISRAEKAIIQRGQLIVSMMIAGPRRTATCRSC